MSTVFRAKERQLNRLVAIKVPNRSVLFEPKHLQKFIEEGRKLGRINHPNVLTVHHFFDTGELDDKCYIVAEWMDTSLDKVIQSEQLKLDTALFFAKEIARGLKAIHNAGIVHRDIKTSNIFLSSNFRRVKIGDLGIASDVGADHTLRATPKYVAPESYKEGGAPNFRIDIYSLGVMLYEMILGEARFKSAFPEIYSTDSEKDQIRRWLHWHTDMARVATPLNQVKPAIPEQLSDLVARMMSKNPDDRPANMDEVIQGLEMADGSVVLDIPMLETDDTPEETGKKKMTMGRILAYSVVGILVLFAAVVVVPVMMAGGGVSGEEASAAATSAFEARNAAIEYGVDTDSGPEPFQQADVTYREGAAALESGDFATALTLFQAARAGYEETLGVMKRRPVEFEKGSTEEEIALAMALCTASIGECDRAWFETEAATEESISPFIIGEREITNAQFARFVEETGHVTQAEQQGFSYVWNGERSMPQDGYSWRLPGGPAVR